MTEIHRLVDALPTLPACNLPVPSSTSSRSTSKDSTPTSIKVSPTSLQNKELHKLERYHTCYNMVYVCIHKVYIRH